jgi:hypothetical protein
MFSKAPCGLSASAVRQKIWWNALSYAWAYPHCPLPPEPKHLNAYFAVSATPAAPCITGDMNCDTDLDLDDINPFVVALSNPAGYAAQYPNCNRLNGDCDHDGDVDFDDIDPFVALLGG